MDRLIEEQVAARSALRIEQCLNDRTIRYLATPAPAGDLHKGLFKPPKICDLAMGVRKVVERDRLDLGTGVTATIDELQQSAHLVERESKLSAAADKA